MKGNISKKIKVAIVADVLISRGGAEHVIENLLDLFPNADVITSIDNGDNKLKRIRERLVKKWDKPWFVPRKFSFFAKLFINAYWESLDLKDYDVVITSSDEYSSKSVITGPETIHICYCHTPPRYLYPEYSSWDDVNSGSFKRSMLLNWLRIADYTAGQRPDVIIVSSITVRNRIRKYYKRDAIMISPPVDIISKFKVTKKGDYYLYVGSLDKRKGLELAVRVFNKLNSRFVVIGDGNEYEHLKSIAKKNIDFLGTVSDETRNTYYRNAKGFVFPSIDEDFGIAPVEAMSWGVPVLAYKSGGLRETVIDGVTGSFFEDFNESSFLKAFKKFRTIRFDPRKIHRHSLKYRSDIFKQKIMDLVRSELKKRENI